MSDELDRNWRDQTAFVTKSQPALVPILGGPLGELDYRGIINIPRLMTVPNALLNMFDSLAIASRT